MSLDGDLERFAAAHAAELSAADTFTLGRAAGIVSRVHAHYLPGGSRFGTDNEATDSDAPVTVRDGLT